MKRKVLSSADILAYSKIDFAAASVLVDRYIASQRKDPCRPLFILDSDKDAHTTNAANWLRTNYEYRDCDKGFTVAIG